MRVVYTDGACSGNPGPGGWAWAVPEGPYASGFEARSTNQRMEIMAVLAALRSLAGPVEVRSDSTYVVNCFRDRWWEGWLARGWTNSQRKPVANQDLWEPLISLYRSRASELRFTWVKGHGTDAMNDVVDRLAVEAAQTQTARAGDVVPAAASLGPADRAGGGAGRDRRLPAGRLVLVAGQRDANVGKLAEIVRAKHEMHPDLKVVTTLRAGAQAAVDAGVPFVAVLPFPDSSHDWLRELRPRAAAVLELERKVPDTKQKVGGSLARRDAWLARNVDEAVVAWDGEDQFAGRLARSLKDHLGEEEVWLLEP